MSTPPVLRSTSRILCLSLRMSDGGDPTPGGSILETHTSGHRESNESSFVVKYIAARHDGTDDSHPAITSTQSASRRSFASQKSEVFQKSFASQKSQGPPVVSPTADASQASAASQTSRTPQTADAPPTTAASKPPNVSQTAGDALHTAEPSKTLTLAISTASISSTTILHSSTPSSRVPVATSTTGDTASGVSSKSIPPSPASTSAFTGAQGHIGHPTQSSHGLLIGVLLPAVIVPVIILSIVLFTLLVLRRRRRAMELTPATAIQKTEDAVTPFPVPSATSNPFSERLSDSYTEQTTTVHSTASSFLKYKRAYDISPALPIAPAPLPVLGVALPVTVVEPAMQRTGRSANDLMRSLNRAAEYDRLPTPTYGEVMPPQYEP